MFRKIYGRLKKKTKSELFQQMVDDVEDIRPEKIEPEKLSSLLEGIRARQEKLFEAVATTRNELEPEILSGDVIALDKSQERIRENHREYFELEENRKRLYDAQQRQIIRQGISGLIGDRGNTILSSVVLVLIMVVLVLLSIEMMLLNEEVDGVWLWRIFAIDAAACAVFQFEFFLRRHYAEDRSWFWRKNWVDFVSSIPIPPVTVIDYHRWGRLIRLIRILRLWRAMRIGMFLWRGMERLQRVTNVRLMRRSLILTAAFVIAGAFAAFYAENPPPPGGFTYSLWWSFNAVATGDFADLHKPVGTLLRLVTALLIISGMVVVSVFIATLTAVYQGKEMEPARKKQKEMHEWLQELREGMGTLVKQNGGNEDSRSGPD